MLFMKLLPLLLLLPICTFQKSCKSNSGRVISRDGRAYYCDCNPLTCTYFDDCCDKNVISPSTEPYRHLPKPECFQFVINGSDRHIYVISKCGKSQTALSSEEIDQCEQHRTPDFHHTQEGLLFMNEACGICNGFKSSLIKSKKNWFYSLIKLCNSPMDSDCLLSFTLPEVAVRPCKNIDSCPLSSPQKLKSSCESGATDFSPCIQQENRLFKNSYCASCNLQHDCLREDFNFTLDNRAQFSFSNGELPYSAAIEIPFSMLSFTFVAILLITLLRADDNLMKNVLKHFLLIVVCICVSMSSFFQLITLYLLYPAVRNSYHLAESFLCQLIVSCMHLFEISNLMFICLYGFDLLLKVNAALSADWKHIKRKYASYLIIGFSYGAVFVLGALIHGRQSFKNGSDNYLSSICHFLHNRSYFIFVVWPNIFSIGLAFLLFLILCIVMCVKYKRSPSTTRKFTKFLHLYLKIASVMLINLIVTIIFVTTWSLQGALIAYYLRALQGFFIGLVFLSSRKSWRKMKLAFKKLIYTNVASDNISDSSSLNHSGGGSNRDIQLNIN